MFLRVSIATICFLLGFVFFPLFFLGAFIAWTIVQDIREAPERQKVEAELSALTRAPVSAQDIRDACESPAEVAFLDAMIDAYDLKTGEGALEGGGLRLTSQKGMGEFRIYRNNTSYQYRVDFLIDEHLIVEVDGAAYHSTPEAIARDTKRDADLARKGYQTLRIPARVVFGSPLKAIAAVENAREALRKGEPVNRGGAVAPEKSDDAPVNRRPYLSRAADTLDEIEVRSKRYHAFALIDKAIGTVFSRFESIVENAIERAALEVSPKTHSEDERRRTFGNWLRMIVDAVNSDSTIPNQRRAAFSEAVKVMSSPEAREYCERAIENAVDAHMTKLKAAHTSLFPELDAFPDNALTSMSQRDTLIKELRELFFENADPDQFYHPYDPPTAKRNIIFLSWWRKEVAGQDPLTRSLANLSAALEASKTK